MNSVAMEEKYKLIIAREFSDTPGARDEADGDFSGDVFLKKLLLPKFEKAVEVRNPRTRK